MNIGKLKNKTFQLRDVDEPKNAEPVDILKEAACCRCTVGNCDDCQCARKGRFCHSCGSVECENKEVCSLLCKKVTSCIATKIIF